VKLVVGCTTDGSTATFVAGVSTCSAQGPHRFNTM